MHGGNNVSKSCQVTVARMAPNGFYLFEIVSARRGPYLAELRPRQSSSSDATQSCSVRSPYRCGASCRTPDTSCKHLPWMSMVSRICLQAQLRGTNEANPKAGRLASQLAKQNSTKATPQTQQEERLVVSHGHPICGVATSTVADTHVKHSYPVGLIKQLSSFH